MNTTTRNALYFGLITTAGIASYATYLSLHSPHPDQRLAPSKVSINGNPTIPENEVLIRKGSLAVKIPATKNVPPVSSLAYPPSTSTTVKKKNLHTNISSILQRYNKKKGTQHVTLSDPSARSYVTAELEKQHQNKTDHLRAEAERRGIDFTYTDQNGGRHQLTSIRNGTPIYRHNDNSESGISANTTLLHIAPFNLDGTGVEVGIWESGMPNSGNIEFIVTAGAFQTSNDYYQAPRIVYKEKDQETDKHATSVAGVLIGQGINSAAKGTAPAAIIHGYNWDNDVTEMMRVFAASSAETDKIYLSNHSYGEDMGWDKKEGVYVWIGTYNGSNDYFSDFGTYDDWCEERDSISYAAPYHLAFYSSGNDGQDNPTPGTQIRLSNSSTKTTAYDPNIHPPQDSKRHNNNNSGGGFENIGNYKVCKNVITVGAILSVATNGMRDLRNVQTASFSAKGPTDDGRIKPDMVAQGEDVITTQRYTDYLQQNGTSFSSPGATGAAALVLTEYQKLHNGEFPRASTLKGLMLHSADDVGNPGPDYSFGWGVVNAKAAVEILRSHVADSSRMRLTEGRLGTANTSDTYTIEVLAGAPLKASLCWTDPAAPARTLADDRSPNLINDLDVRITAPDGTVFRPYVMPFVGDWSDASMGAPAITGDNITDNMEQVFIASAPQTGSYTVSISHKGTLTNNEQYYALIITGSQGTIPEVQAYADKVAAKPNKTVTLTIDSATGITFSSTPSAHLERNGFSNISANSVTRVSDTRLTCTFTLTNATPGSWNAVVTQSGKPNIDLGPVVGMIGRLWSEDFESPLSGWDIFPTNDLSYKWTLATDFSESGSNSYKTMPPVYGVRSYLETPAIALPADLGSLELSFYHRYELQDNLDGVNVEISVDNSPFVPIHTSLGSFRYTTNGPGQIMSYSNAGSYMRNAKAWTKTSTSFKQAKALCFDVSKYAGKTISFRWAMVSNNSVSSLGFWLDTVEILGTSASATSLDPGTPTNQAPIAHAGADVVVTDADGGGNESVPLDGTGSSDPDGTIANWAWSWIGGSANGETTSGTFPVGSTTVTLTVTDNLGATHSGIMTVTVNTPSAPATLLVHWKLDDGSGSVVSDATASGIDGTLSSTASWSSIGVDQGSLNLNGVDQSVTTALSGQSLNAYSISFWVKSAANGQNKYASPFSQDASSNDFQIDVGAGSGAYQYRGTSTAVFGDAPLDEWVFLTLTCNGADTYLYYNGSRVATLTGTADNAFSELHLGSNRNKNKFFNGAVDDFRLYSGALTDTEIFDLYTSYPTPNTNPWTGWQELHFSLAEIASGIAAPDQDPDGDGISNQLEYALNLNPATPSTNGAGTPGHGGLPAVERSPVDNVSLIYRKNLAATDTSFIVEFSPDLTSSSWSPATVTETILSDDGQTQVIKASLPTNSEIKMFLRLKVQN